MKITVRDFQSLGSTEIEATGLTVVVGRSNLGKSALIRAVTAALFNRPGEDFIRQGKAHASVTLDGLPGVGTVEWLKGHNLNQFTVNGTLFSKVGLDAPPPITQAGYRDVFIGDKERNKGEEIRPQIAGQFDPPFLLTKPGSFINDVISVVSRLGVLLNANGRCAKDLKGQKANLTLRQGDLEQAEKKLAALQPVVDLAARVEALQVKLTAAREAQALVDKVRGLLANHAALKAVCAQTLPAETSIPENLGVRETRGRAFWRTRGRVEIVSQLALPAAVDLEAVEQQTRAAILLNHGQFLARQWKVLRQIPSLPAESRLPDQVDKAVQAAEMWKDVRARLAEQLLANGIVFRSVQALNGADAMQAEAEAAYQAALAETPICPVCARPMVEAPSPV